MSKIVASFNCAKRINVNRETSPIAYFVFTMSWSLGAYDSDVSRYAMDYRIYDPVVNKELSTEMDSTSSSHSAIVR